MGVDKMPGSAKKQNITQCNNNPAIRRRATAWSLSQKDKEKGY
jgi:hypothetical protein